MTWCEGELRCSGKREDVWGDACIATASFGYKGIAGFCGIYGDMAGRKVLERGRLREVKRKKEHEKREEACERSYPAKIRLKSEGVR